MKTIRRATLAFLWIMILPPLLLAAPTIPGFYGTIAPALRTVAPTQLPVLKPGGMVYGASVPAASANQLTIFQNQPQAIIDWSSFNIGSNAWVYFNQQGNTSWVALNRIWDNSPSQIYGHLTADGKIYLINQNGILFGPGAQVNVSGLVASSLNIQNSDFLNGIFHFTAQDYRNLVDGSTDNTVYGVGSGNLTTPGTVSNAGNIQTGNYGSVFLIGPQVENAPGGSILAPSGQIGLVAGTDVELDLPVISGSGAIISFPGGETRTALVVTINDCANGGCTATNDLGATLATDTGGSNPVGLGGVVGMYGNIVNQNGLIRSIAGVQNGGHIELLASDVISTGPGSVTETPVSSSPDLVDESFTTTKSDITLAGLLAGPAALAYYGSTGYGTNLITHQGDIWSPSGIVTMNATGRVYLAPGSQVDVSGLWVYEDASAGLLQVQLNTANLRDYYLQKGGCSRDKPSISPCFRALPSGTYPGTSRPRVQRPYRGTRPGVRWISALRATLSLCRGPRSTSREEESTTLRVL